MANFQKRKKRIISNLKVSSIQTRFQILDRSSLVISGRFSNKKPYFHFSLQEGHEGHEDYDEDDDEEEEEIEVDEEDNPDTEEEEERSIGN